MKGHTNEQNSKGHKKYGGHSFEKGQTAWNKGISPSKETIDKLKKSLSGIIRQPCSEATRRKISEAHKGDKSWNWKGGIEPENKRIRKSLEYKLWREAVYKRDDWTCQKYKTKGGKLHPHHIQNFAGFPELRFTIDNGITLSEKAHKEFHKIYGFHSNTKEQLEEFIC